MATNFDLSDLYCALGTDQHYFQQPIQISCSHFVCKECIPIGTELICNKCNKKNENDLKKASEQASFRAKTILSLHFNELCNDLINRFNEKILLLESRNVFILLFMINEIKINISFLKSVLKLSMLKLKMIHKLLKLRLKNKL